MNEIAQDASSVGNALKTISMRIRAMNEETGEFDDTLKTISGDIFDLTRGQVSIMQDANTYKDIYTILDDISKVWGSLTDKEHATLTETLFGKHRANIGSAIISNFEQARKAIETMENADGSALNEMNTIMESISYRANIFKETLVGIAQGLFSQDFMKSMVDSGTRVLNVFDDLTPSISFILEKFASLLELVTKLADTIGGIPLLITGIGLKSIGNIKTWLYELKEVQMAINGISALSTSFNGGTNMFADTAVVTQYANQLRGLSVQQVELALSTKMLTAEQKQQIMVELGLVASENKIQSELLQTTLAQAGLSAEKQKAVLTELNLINATTGEVVANKACTKSELEKRLALEGVTVAQTEQIMSTLGMSTANATATVSFDLLTASIKKSIVAFGTFLFTTPAGWATIAVTAIVGAIYAVDTYNKKQQEIREGFIETAQEAKNLANNINTLYQAYSDMKKGVENGTESKENLTTATNDLLEALGYEGEAVGNLIRKYGTLSEAVQQATADRLKESLPDLSNGVNAELENLLNDGKKIPYQFIIDDKKANKQLNAFIKEFSDKTEDIGIYHGQGDSTYRIILDGDTTNADGIKQYLDNMKLLQQALFDEYGANDVQKLDIYKQLSQEITKLETAYNKYDDALSDYNKTAAQAQIIESLIGKEVPKTVNEYKEYRQELIKSAKNSGLFIGTQKDISNAIDNTLSKMDEFSDIQSRINRLEIAENKFNVVFPTNSFEALKKSLLGRLSDEQLDIAIQIPDLFDGTFDGTLDSITKRIEEWEANSTIEVKFNYAEYSEQVDNVIKNIDTLQSALDNLNSGKSLEAKDITELANTFPDYSTKILSAANSTEELKLVLTDIKRNAPKSLINTLENLSGLSKQDQDAVNGLISVLTTVNDKTSTYADTLADLETKESLLSSVYKEMHDDGQISISTYQKLIEMGDDYANMVTVINGKITVNTQDLKELTKKKYEDEIATLKLTKAELGYNIASNPQNYSLYAEKINAINDDIEAKEKALELLNGFDYTKDTKESKDDPWKDEAEAEIAKIQHLEAMLQITHEQYIDELDKINQKYFANNEKYLTEFNKYDEEVFKGRRELAEKTFNDTIEGIEKEIDSLEKLKDTASIDADKIIDPKATEELKKFNEEMQKTFGLGNVDLTKRPKVSAEAMRKAGYEAEDGETATVYSSTEFIWQGDDKNGKYVAVHYTPILPDGTVLD